MGQSACGYICNKDRESNTYFFPELANKKSSYDSISNPEFSKALEKKNKEKEKSQYNSNTYKNGYDSWNPAADYASKIFKNQSLLNKLIKLQSIVRGYFIRLIVKTKLAENYKSIFKSYHEKFNIKKIEENEKKFHEYKTSDFNLTKTSNLQPGEKKFFNRLLSEKDSFYVGEVNLQNEKHGYGRLIEINGNLFEGNWSKNKFTGNGRKIDSKGILYEGIIHILYEI